MKMILKRKILFLFLIVLYSVGANAQNLRYSTGRKLTTASNTLNYKIPGKSYVFLSTVYGSVFLYENWLSGSLNLENGAVYDSLSLKLNTFLEELILFNRRAGALITVDKDAVKEFTLINELGNKEIYQKMYLDEIPAGYRYLNVLYDGKIKLFLWNKTDEIAESPYYDLTGSLRNTKYVLKKIYYLDLPDKGMIRFIPQKRSVIELFPEHKKEIKRLQRREHLTYKGNSEIVRAIKLLETNIFNLN